MSRRTRRRAVICAGLAAAIAVTVPAYTAYAAGGSGAAAAHATPSSSHRSAAPTKKPTVTPYSPPPAPGGGSTVTATTITPSAPFAVRVDPTGKKPMDQTWPSAENLFTQAELQQVLPKLTGMAASACHTGDLPGGGSTHQFATCTLNLQITGEPQDDQSKLMINIRGFGLPAQIGKQWSKDLAQAQARSAHRPGLYTFYANKSLGASAAFTDGTTTKVLLQHGDVAGEIWFSGIGFTTLNPDYLKSRRLYRTTVVPALVQLLATKLSTEKAAA